MAYKPGESGNLLGRPRRIDPRSEDLQRFCKERRDDIKRVGEIALKKAIESQEPWAIKLCMEFFYPKPGTFVAVSKEETHEVSFNFINALPYEDQQTFLKIWMKSKKFIGAFNAIEIAQQNSIDDHSTINKSE